MSKAVAESHEEMIPSGEQIACLMDRNLQAQGSSLDLFFKRVDELCCVPRFDLTATRTGFVSLSLEALRDILTELQRLAATSEQPFPDPAGLILSVNSGDYVVRGELIASVRCISRS